MRHADAEANFFAVRNDSTTARKIRCDQRELFSEAVEVCEFGSEEVTFDQRSDEAMVGGCWELNPTGGTENEGLNEGLRRVSCRNLQVLRCHPCACKLFCISFPLNS